MPEIKSKIPEGYDKCYTVEDNGKKYDVYYNSTEKDSLKAYLKIEVN